jgi:hypothetical protein
MRESEVGRWVRVRLYKGVSGRVGLMEGGR